MIKDHQHTNTQPIMTTFKSFNDECFCGVVDNARGCALMKCGHACHPECTQTLNVCPWCRENIVFMQPSVQRAYRPVVPAQQPVIPAQPNLAQRVIELTQEIMMLAERVSDITNRIG